MSTIWQFFVRNSQFSYLLMVALTGFGILSLILIPKENTPEVQIPVGVVTTVLPGAPAADIETLVTNEIERQLNGSLENVNKITSVSRESVSSVTVEFDASADIDESIKDLKDEIDKVKADLPADAEDPIVSEVNFVDQPIMNIAVSGPYTPSELTTLADDLENEIESITGVSRASFNGVRSHEITVIADQTSLNRYGISLSTLIQGISAANRTFPVGQIESDGVIHNVAFEGDIQSGEEIAGLAITTRGGQPVYVRDVARVVDGLGDINTISRLSVNSQPSEQSMTIDVFKQRGGDITRITQAVNDKLASLQEPGGLLEAATVKTVYDSGNDIKKELLRLSSSGLMTVALVILVLILAIGWREAAVAGSSIPLSFLIGFIGLYTSGNTVNFVSLFALILAVGILVDSSIVMVEGINRRMKDDPTIDKKEAALRTVNDFAVPIMTGTLTTVAMFSGLFLISGVTGQFIAAIPFTINFILFASLLVALGFVPLIASTVLRRRSATKFEQRQVALSHSLEEWYRSKLNLILGNKKREQRFLWGIRLCLVIAILLPITGVVKVIFFEQSDVDFIYTEVKLPEGSTRQETDIAMRRVEEVLYQNDSIESFVSTIGSGSQFGGGGSNEKLGNMFINLKTDRTKTSTEVVEELRAATASMRDLDITIDQPSDGPPTGAALGYRFIGNDLNELTQIAERGAQVLKEIPNTTSVTTSVTNNNTEFVLTLDKAKTAAAGLDPFTVSQILRAAVYGTDATTLTTLNDEIDVVVKLNLTGDQNIDSTDTNVTSIEMLENIELPTPSGDTVLLSSLVTTGLRESSSVIQHEDAQRVVSVTGDITSAGNIADINAEFEIRMREQNLIPDNVSLQVGGETEESTKAFEEMILAVIVGAVLMLAVLVLQFNSFRYARYVLSILPYSLIGIMAGLAITQLPLSFPSVMGFIALSGIVVNNSILLIDMMNQMRREQPNKPIREVVLDAASSRLRPILLTSITTVVGMIPLTQASELWSPLAYAIMFGLTFSVIITLVLIPITYERNPGEVD